MEISNRAARFHYEIKDRYIAGMVLTGSEIKSIREGKVSFNDSFCYFQGDELYVKNLHIAEYKNATYANHDPLRERKLLLQKRELRKLKNAVQEKGYTIVPLRIFINEKGWAKMEIALVRGKKIYDKRETIKQREAQQEIMRRWKR
ncbi:MAG: SsrA-binding protein SmpB [Thermoflavifilum sp.]|jgi:SsrA-binding protein|uniref:SsrA-binding protein SmpB n=1 Tax=Thermoflavifilum sp. TaxID=1968839 RepID=UPI0018A54FFE|nr:SsrA-binding protein SmpB [Thermoflavifilum sp.]QOR76049.1 MAG: SsrA-binding protein SmpB [Thermoflavifilum sp.]